jgi:hypothetical protein
MLMHIDRVCTSSRKSLRSSLFDMEIQVQVQSVQDQDCIGHAYTCRKYCTTK